MLYKIDILSKLYLFFILYSSENAGGGGIYRCFHKNIKVNYSFDKKTFLGQNDF